MAPTCCKFGTEIDPRSPLFNELLLGSTLASVLILVSLISCACCRKKKKKQEMKRPQPAVKSLPAKPIPTPTPTKEQPKSETTEKSSGTTGGSIRTTPSSEAARLSFDSEDFWIQQAEEAPSFKLQSWSPDERNDVGLFELPGRTVKIHMVNPSLSLLSAPNLMEEDEKPVKSMRTDRSIALRGTTPSPLPKMVTAPTKPGSSKLNLGNEAKANTQRLKSSTEKGRVESLTVALPDVDQDKTISIPMAKQQRLLAKLLPKQPLALKKVKSPSFTPKKSTAPGKRKRLVRVKKPVPSEEKQVVSRREKKPSSRRS